jgi:hypothetical protein|tara:strand:+ start:9890 stop:10228 length:339 start_codon:yes stop_codon:yes gene_type:complete
MRDDRSTRAFGGTMTADANADATTTTTTTTTAATTTTVEDSAATRAVDVVTRTLALAAEARGPGERKRARALFESALKQYVAELDEMRAMVERAGAGLRLEEDAGKDGMETN